MCRLAETEFAADATAAKAARDWIAALLEHWDLPELAETAALLVSETVTNAIRHAGSSPIVTAAMTDGVVEVGVMDRDKAHAPPCLVDQRPHGHQWPWLGNRRHTGQRVGDGRVGRWEAGLVPIGRTGLGSCE